LPDEKRNKLRYLLNDVCDGDARHHFGLLKTRGNAFTITQDSTTITYEAIDLASLESIVRLLLEAMDVGALTTGKRRLKKGVKRWLIFSFFFARHFQCLAGSLDGSGC
jgi:hypothetical protein